MPLIGQLAFISLQYIATSRMIEYHIYSAMSGWNIAIIPAFHYSLAQTETKGRSIKDFYPYETLQLLFIMKSRQGGPCAWHQQGFIRACMIPMSYRNPETFNRKGKTGNESDGPQRDL